MEWVLGKVEQVRRGQDGQARECVIVYKSTGETDRIITVERQAREVIKLLNIEDTSFYEEIENARKICREVGGASEVEMVQHTMLGDGDVVVEDLGQGVDEYVKQMRLINSPVCDLGKLAAGVFHGSSYDRRVEEITQDQEDVPSSRIEEIIVIKLDTDSPLYFV